MTKMTPTMATVAVAMALSSGAAPASAFLAPVTLSRLSSTSHSHEGAHGAPVGVARGSSSVGAAAVAASLRMVAQPPVKPQKVRSAVGGVLLALLIEELLATIVVLGFLLCSTWCPLQSVLRHARSRIETGNKKKNGFSGVSVTCVVFILCSNWCPL